MNNVIEYDRVMIMTKKVSLSFDSNGSSKFNILLSFPNMAMSPKWSCILSWCC